MKLLIIDDQDAAAREQLRVQLEAAGHVVLRATDPTDARTVLDALQGASGGERATESDGQTISPSAPDPHLRERIERLEQAHAVALAINRSLEARVQERTAKVELANHDLQSFSYSVSHDLRAPLRAIGGFTEIVLRDHAAAIPADAVHLLERVVANVRRMNYLIDELLEFSRVGVGSLNIQTVNISRLVRECLAALGGDRPDARAKITIGDLPPCHADLLLLKQVLLNLLANALKFSAKRESPRIDIGAEVRAGEFIYHVRDSGVGFDMRMAHKLFQVFQRLHAQKDFDGIGVGLAIVRRVIERHGGRVWADSAPDAGATFYFSLPIGGGPSEAADR